MEEVIEVKGSYHSFQSFGKLKDNSLIAYVGGLALGRAWHLARPKSQHCLLAAYWEFWYILPLCYFPQEAVSCGIRILCRRRAPKLSLFFGSFNYFLYLCGIKTIINSSFACVNLMELEESEGTIVLRIHPKKPLSFNFPND